MLARAGAAVALASALVGAAPAPSEAELEAMWQRFGSVYGRNFVGEEQEARRFLAFKHNVGRAAALNHEQGANCTDLFDRASCVFGMTKFMDMFADEFASTRLGYKPRKERPRHIQVLSPEELGAAAPLKKDWRAWGAVTEVKDQGQCGSCWAFSTTEEVESQMFMKTGKLPVLSTQQIISCDKSDDDDGCNGGDTVSAYEYLQEAGGLDTAKHYPDRSHIHGRTRKCIWDGHEAAKVTGFSYATKPCESGSCSDQNEHALAKALAAKGPISICVNAEDWQLYSGGVYSARCSGAADDIDHCVQLVGYNRKKRKPYWIVRNSWNTDWGIDGYMYLEMGRNLCGIADEATIVEVAAGEGALVV